MVVAIVVDGFVVVAVVVVVVVVVVYFDICALRGVPEEEEREQLEDRLCGLLSGTHVLLLLLSYLQKMIAK